MGIFARAPEKLEPRPHGVVKPCILSMATLSSHGTSAVPHIARQIQCDLWNGAYKEYRRNPRATILVFQANEWRFCLEEQGGGVLYKTVYWNEHIIEKAVYQIPLSPPTSPIMRGQARK